jgi:hypothetical protein
MPATSAGMTASINRMARISGETLRVKQKRRAAFAALL